MHRTDQDKALVFDKLAEEDKWWDFSNQYETTRRLDLIFNQLLSKSELQGQAFLDAGCGGGHFSKAAVGYGADVVSLDIGLNLLKQVGDSVDSKKVLGSLMELPVSKDYFDVVVCTDVIEHTPDPLYAIKELSAVIKPGGLLILTVPCRLWNPVVNLATALKLRPFEGYENFLWPGTIRRTLVSLGFDVEELRGFNFCPVFSRKIDVLFKFFDKFYGRLMPWMMVNVAVRARKNK